MSHFVMSRLATLETLFFVAVTLLGLGVGAANAEAAAHSVPTSSYNFMAGGGG